MNLIRGFVITLVTTLIFITAVELIGPDNSMKKYLKFVMGLILISVILNPVIMFFTKGENVITKAIDKYEAEISNTEKEKSSDDEYNKIKEKSFNENFNKNCISLLTKEYKNMEFKSEVDCKINFDKPNDFEIKELRVGVKDKNIKKVQKVKEVDITEKKQVDDEDEIQNKIKCFLSDELSLDKRKIVIYYM